MVLVILSWRIGTTISMVQKKTEPKPIYELNWFLNYFTIFQICFGQLHTRHHYLIILFPFKIDWTCFTTYFMSATRWYDWIWPCLWSHTLNWCHFLYLIQRKKPKRAAVKGNMKTFSQIELINFFYFFLPFLKIGLLVIRHSFTQFLNFSQWYFQLFQNI